MERKQTFTIELGETKRISLFNGTREIWVNLPTKGSNVSIEITVHEIDKE